MIVRAEIQFYTAVVADAALTAAVASRVYPDIAAEGAPLPLIVYERRSSEPVTTIHDGAPVASKVSISASCWAKTRLAAEQLGDEMQLAVHQVASSVNRFGHYDQDTAAYAAVIDFEVWEI